MGEYSQLTLDLNHKTVKTIDPFAVRDNAWQNCNRIPKWVRGREISLDQYNTLPEIAQYCWNSMQDFFKKEKVALKDYQLIEPSAGVGSFYNLLPKDNRIGIDVEQYNPKYIQHDFLTWTPDTNGKPCIAVGNPPFGYRGWLALAFLNRAAEFCDYVGFILPMSFQSDGKGAPKNRVDRMTLAHSENLAGDMFFLPTGEHMHINALWQIWKRGQSPTAPDLSACDEYVELFTVDQRKERLCGVEKMKECDTFLQRTFFNTPPTLVKDFSEVKYSCGYGFIFKKERNKILEILLNADWRRYSNLAAHNCRHISMYHIKKLLLNNLTNA